MNENNNLLKVSMGIVTMFATFLLLFSISMRNQMFQGVSFAFRLGDDFTKTTIVPAQSFPATPVAEITEGIFDLGSEGDIKEEVKTTDGTSLINHYRAVHSAKIKTLDKNPTLKLETLRNEHGGWNTTEISGIDKEEGVLYFLFKTESEEGVSLHDYYTGSYQIIF